MESNAPINPLIDLNPGKLTKVSLSPQLDAASAKAEVAPEKTTDTAEKLKALVKRKRVGLKEELKREKEEEDSSTERWSGLRIKDRIVRQEKWDASMRGKTLVPLGQLGSLHQQGRDQVVIGVLCAPPTAPKQTLRGELYAEWILTDLDKEKPCEASLILVGRALDHWVSADGPGKSQATVGSIFGVLNPQATGKTTAMRASFETQVLKLGASPSLVSCPALGPDGFACRKPCNQEGSGYCGHHSKQSHAARQAEMERLQRRKRPFEAFIIASR